MTALCRPPLSSCNTPQTKREAAGVRYAPKGADIDLALAPVPQLGACDTDGPAAEHGAEQQRVPPASEVTEDAAPSGPPVSSAPPSMVATSGQRHFTDEEQLLTTGLCTSSEFEVSQGQPGPAQRRQAWQELAPQVSC